MPRVRRTDDWLQVRVERGAERLERGVRWLVERYRNEGAQALLNRARSAAAQLLSPPTAPAAPRPVTPQRPVASRDGQQDWPEDVLAWMCGGVALRDLNLVDSLLAQLESMEANEGDPDALTRLYQLDHLATRLRRNAENLRVLAGHDAGVAADKASSLIDLLRAAMSSIEQYTRIEIGWVAALGVVELAADDVSRLLAELLDNATAHSPPSSTVAVSAHVTEQGCVLVRIEDAGIGLPPDRLYALNDRLSAAPMLDSESIDHMGLAVVRRLAANHGIHVRLGRRKPHGTTASVLLPPDVVCEAPAAHWSGPAATTTERPPPGTDAGHHSVSSHYIPPPRGRSSDSTEPAVPAVAPTTTRNGLPRRVPHSLRDTTFPAQPPSPSRADGEESRAGREQLIADLGAFSAGEQAAHELHREQQRPANQDHEDRTSDD